MLLIILNKKHLTRTQRMKLLYAFLKIRSIRFVIGRFVPEKKFRNISVLGYTFWINAFSDFYWTFLEVFIHEEYYFSTQDNSPNILDLGGHIGVTVLYFKWLYPQSYITVFEPLHENLAVLKKNIQRNRLENVQLVEKAVGAKKEEVQFSGDGRAGHVVLDDAHVGGVVQKVSVVPVSDYITQTISFCKMDIEGNETQVIKQLRDVNKLHHIQHMVFEFHAQVKNNMLSDIVNYLEDASFNVSFMTDLCPTNIQQRNFTHFMVIAKQNI